RTRHGARHRIPPNSRTRLKANDRRTTGGQQADNRRTNPTGGQNGQLRTMPDSQRKATGGQLRTMPDSQRKATGGQLRTMPDSQRKADKADSARMKAETKRG